MIPHTYPEDSVKKMVVSEVSPTGRDQWIDYIPVKNVLSPLTNSLPDSRDFTGWSASAQTAYDQVGLFGEPSTATLVTDSNVAGFELIDSPAVVIPDDTATHTARWFVKKDSDETRFPRMELRLTGGTVDFSLLYLNTATGAATDAGSGASSVYEVNSHGDWWEVVHNITNNASGNTSASVRCYTAIGIALGTSTATATGSTIIGNVEIHLNKTIAEVAGTPVSATSGGSAVAAGYSERRTDKDSYIPAIYTTISGSTEVWRDYIPVVTDNTRTSFGTTDDTQGHINIGDDT